MAQFFRTLTQGTRDAKHARRFQERAAVYFACSLLFSLVISAAMLVSPVRSSAFVSVSVTIAPPALPVYVQPVCPGPGYIWTPGYWAWDPVYGYYWVPGTWVLAPFHGALWTPGYWGWANGVYAWNAGYWGPVVGFYGGIDYGFGYTGYGYWGGYWRRGVFYYNRVVTNVNVTRIRTVYSRTVTPVTVRRVSYNGGPRGIRVRPDSAQLAAARQRRFAAVPIQRQQASTARSIPRLRASVNHGRPAIAATPRPGVFTGRGVVRARRAGAPYRAAPLRRGVAPSGQIRRGGRPGFRNQNPAFMRRGRGAVTHGRTPPMNRRGAPRGMTPGAGGPPLGTNRGGVRREINRGNSRGGQAPERRQ